MSPDPIRGSLFQVMNALHWWCTIINADNYKVPIMERGKQQPGLYTKWFIYKVVQEKLLR